MNNTTFELLINEASPYLIGALSYDGDLIKWEYDSLGYYISEDELLEIYEDDLEQIISVINIDPSHITKPHIENDYISFYIEI